MKYTFSIILIWIAAHAFAQTKTDGSPFRFSFHTGANISNMNFNAGSPPPPVHSNASWQAGILAGAAMQVSLNDRLYLQPEYNYLQRNGSDKSINTDYKLYYFSLPVLLHYKLTERFSIYTGPQADLLIHATAGNGTKTNITHDTEERSLTAVAGLDYNITRLFFISARYMQGLNHIGIGQRSNTKEFKYQGACLTAGIRF